LALIPNRRFEDEDPALQSRQWRHAQLHATPLDVSPPSLTPPSHEVVLIDANARPMSDDEIVQFIKIKRSISSGIGAMTRMAEKAYRVADAIRLAGVPVVMGGPHVTEVPDEALGRDGGLRHADAIALGEADETWPR
jgi:radical SAM superfamily enzyme YgiQ (UPF0313 family)